MKKAKRDKYFNTLLYWSDETVKRGLRVMAPVAVNMETFNLVEDTRKLVDLKIHSVEVMKNSNIIDDVDYVELLSRLNVIKNYLKNRATALKTQNI